MKNCVIKKLLIFSKQKRSIQLKIFSTFIGATFFAIILPFIFIQFEPIIEKFLPIQWSPILQILIPLTTIPLGAFILAWSITVQFKSGKGSPAHWAPTQKLIISGPYKLCRNPIQLGGMLYQLGIISLLSSITLGIIAALLMCILGTIYHKTIEEKELELRFGDEYKEYKKNIPFIIPKLKITNLK